MMVYEMKNVTVVLRQDEMMSYNTVTSRLKDFTITKTANFYSVDNEQERQCM
jgi:hypothetical protein